MGTYFAFVLVGSGETWKICYHFGAQAPQAMQTRPPHPALLLGPGLACPPESCSPKECAAGSYAVSPTDTCSSCPMGSYGEKLVATGSGWWYSICSGS